MADYQLINKPHLITSVVKECYICGCNRPLPLLARCLNCREYFCLGFDEHFIAQHHYRHCTPESTSYKVSDNYGDINFQQLKAISKKLNKPYENTLSENIELIKIAQLDKLVFEEFTKRLRQHDKFLEKTILKKAGLIKSKQEIFRFSDHHSDTISLTPNRKKAINTKSNYHGLYLKNIVHDSCEISFQIYDITSNWYNFMIGLGVCHKIEELPIDLDTKHFGSSNNPNAVGIHFHKEHRKYVTIYEHGKAHTLIYDGHPLTDNDIFKVKINIKSNKAIFTHRGVELLTSCLPVFQCGQGLYVGFRYAIMTKPYLIKLLD